MNRCACHGIKAERCPSLDTLARLHEGRSIDCPDQCEMCELDRSRGRMVFAALCTVVTLAIVLVTA